MMRCFSSCFEPTRMWRSTERAALAKRPLDEIEPRAVFGGEHELKASFRLRRQPSLGLPRDMRGVIVEDDLDRGHRGVGSIQHIEEFDEFAAAMAVLNEGVHLACQQVAVRERRLANQC